MAFTKIYFINLWSVDDAATRDFIIEYYKGLATVKEPAEALVSAQRSLQDRSYSPDKWAALVLLN